MVWNCERRVAIMMKVIEMLKVMVMLIMNDADEFIVRPTII